MIKKEKNAMPSQNATFIASMIEVDGNLRVSNVVHIEGKVRGDIEPLPGAQSAVFIRKGGEVRGNVSASTVIVSGRLEGEIRADEHLEIHAEAVVIGDMYYRSLEMTDGARVNGTLNCLDEVAEIRVDGDDDAPGADAPIGKMRVAAEDDAPDDGESLSADRVSAPGAKSPPRR